MAESRHWRQSSSGPRPNIGGCRRGLLCTMKAGRGTGIAVPPGVTPGQGRGTGIAIPPGAFVSLSSCAPGRTVLRGATWGAPWGRVWRWLGGGSATRGKKLHSVPLRHRAHGTIAPLVPTRVTHSCVRLLALVARVGATASVTRAACKACLKLSHCSVVRWPRTLPPCHTHRRAALPGGGAANLFRVALQ